MPYAVELSRKSSVAGLAIVVVGLLSAAVAVYAGTSDQSETYLEQRTGSGYFVVVGLASVGLALWFGRALAMAWRRRDALIAIDELSIEIQTLRGRRRVMRDELRSIGYDSRTRRVVVVDRDGRSYRPLLQPRRTSWSEVGATMSAIVGGTQGPQIRP